MKISERCNKLLHPYVFEKADRHITQLLLDDIVVPEDQYILRMMIKSPETVDSYLIPDKLQWLAETIKRVSRVQEGSFRSQPYVYVTVRSGVVRSETDDEWHVDGFSMRVPHVPEQNYIWSNCYPTEVLDQQFVIPEDFNPLKHNIHTFFQDRAEQKNIKALKEKHVAIIDPYIVHRRPKVPVGTKRCFFRISFVPIEIEDDTCTPNPLMQKKVYNRTDIRKTLVRY